MRNKQILLSGRAVTTNAENVSADRYSFLNLSDAEPNLGVASANDYVLVYNTHANTSGNRLWSKSLITSYDHANSAYDSQNTTGVYANASFLKANSAYGSQNTTGTYANAAYAQANSASLYANGAFVQANAAYGSQNTTGTYANAAFLKANSAYASQNVTGTYANNAYDQANSAASYANSSFLKANSAYASQNVTGTYANAAYAQANSASLYANGAFVEANSAYDSQNTTGVYANAAFLKANSAYAQANSASLYANGAFVQANAAYGSQNTTGSYANAAFLKANSAYAQANSASLYANGAFVQANAAYDSQNVTGVYANSAYNQANSAALYANGAFVQANAAYGSQNTTGSYANSAFLKANSAYASQNVTGTYANNAYDQANSAASYANSAFLKANSAYESQNTTGVYANAAYAQANSASLYANGAFLKANSAYESQNVTGTYANNAYNQANSAASYANSAFVKANSAYESQNTTGVYANASFLKANSAYDSQNVTGTYANAAFLKANSAYDSQNVTGTYANSAYVHANSAYDYANTRYSASGGTISGNVTITSNLTVLGNVTFVGNVTSLQVTGNSGQFFGYASNGFTALYAGIPVGYDFQPQTVFQVSANDNGYAQINIQNINGGGDASGDYVATADNGTELDTYVDLGIGSSTHSDPEFTLIGPNDAYLYAHGNTSTSGGDLVLGTFLPQNDVIIAAGGMNVENEQMRIIGSSNTINVRANLDTSLSKSVLLGPIANVHITGGTNDDYIRTDGLGNLIFTSVSSANVIKVLYATTNASFVQANSAYGSQNTTGVYANAAFLKANSAYASQNVTGTYANNAYLHANSGFIHANAVFETINNLSFVANTTNTTVIAVNDQANAAFDKANAAYASQNVTGTYANNAYAQANSAALYANGAFIAANTADDKAVSAGVYANGAFIAANTADGKATSAGVYANGAFVQANASFLKANSAYASQNVTGTYANNSYAQANSAALYANGAFIQANSAYDLANSAAQSPYANAAFLKANSAYDSQNVTGTYANNAYAQANSASLYANGAFLAANTPSHVANSAALYANGAFVQANAAYEQSNSAALYANGAFVQANSVFVQSNAAFIQANAAYGQANSGSLYANGAFIQSNAAYDQANSGSLYANGAFVQANASYASQNVTGTYANNAYAQANSASLYANGAFIHANAAFNVANNSIDTYVRAHANASYNTANAAFARANSSVFSITANSYEIYTNTSTGNIQIGLANVNASIGTFGGATAIPVINVDGYGRVQSVSNTTITVPPGTYIFPNNNQLTTNSNFGNVLIGLANVNSTIGTFGGASVIPIIQTDGYGRITNIVNSSISIPSGTNIVNSSFITANSPSGNVALSLTTTGVYSGTYGGNGTLPVISVDQYGRVTSAANGSATVSLNALSTIIRNSYTATAAQTAFNTTTSFLEGYADVYVNGIKLSPADYTANPAGSITILNPTLIDGDAVDIQTATTYVVDSNTRYAKVTFTATAGQTSFTTAYTPSNINVYLNGLRLKETNDFVAVDGTTVTLTVACELNDIVEIEKMGIISTYLDNQYLATRYANTATSNGQTTFTVTGGYKIGFVDVYLNGIKLNIPSDVIASDGSTIVMQSSIVETGDNIEVIGIGPEFTPANAISVRGGTIYGSLIVTENVVANAVNVATVYFNDGTQMITAASGSGTGITWKIISANTTANTTEGFLVDTTTANVYITLNSSPSLGNTARIVDMAGNFAINNCIIKGNGNKVMGTTDDFIISSNNAGIGLVYSNATYGWRIIENP